MLTGALIILAELIVLLRLALPDFIAWAESRHDDFYGATDGDCHLARVLNDVRTFHDTANITEAK